jgi:NAD(P)-dependent dehydrogenase (short-subunit alcohol dehydrogenase family)
MTQIDSSSVDYLSLLRLDGRGCIVLGSGPGMGRAAAHALSQAGASVLCVDVDESMANTVAREVGGYACTADITKREEVERVFAEAKAKIGRLDSLVDIVGYNSLKLLLDHSDADFTWVFESVMKHAYFVIQIGARAMADTGGSMVFVGSNSGLVSFEKQVVYGAFKAALHHLIRGAAYELGPKGIRVNAVAPGFTRVPRLLDNLPGQVWDEVNSVIPLRRANDPSDVAGGILFLLSDLARQITGHTLVIDGGQTLTAPIPSLTWAKKPKNNPS